MADGPVLTSRAWERAVNVAFQAFQSVDDYVSEFVVEVTADDLAARVPVLVAPGSRELPQFLGDLSDDFRGWDGIRSWQSLEDQLRVDATWLSGGHVALLLHITPSVYDKWTLTVEVTVEAGEELRGLARELEDFMTA